MFKLSIRNSGTAQKLANAKKKAANSLGETITADTILQCKESNMQESCKQFSNIWSESKGILKNFTNEREIGYDEVLNEYYCIQRLTTEVIASKKPDPNFDFDVKLNKTMDFQMLLEFALNQPKSAFIRSEKVLGAFRRYHGQKTAGYKFEEPQEHLYLAQKYNYKDKYSFLGKLKRLKYRFRRALWYFKRGGINELIKRIINWKII